MIFSFPPISPHRSNLTCFIRHNSISKLTYSMKCIVQVAQQDGKCRRSTYHHQSRNREHAQEGVVISANPPPAECPQPVSAQSIQPLRAGLEMEVAMLGSTCTRGGVGMPGVGTNMHSPSWADPLKTGGDIRGGSS